VPDRQWAGERSGHASHNLAAAIRADITSGRLPTGARLPSYRRLAEEHGVAQNTAQAAVRLLQSEGWVTIRPASGAYVRDRTEEPLISNPDQLRVEVAEVRERLRETRKGLTAAEEAVASLLDRLAAD
jgi:DNA-binding FadR family transcriptional regulator